MSKNLKKITKNIIKIRKKISNSSFYIKRFSPLKNKFYNCIFNIKTWAFKNRRHQFLSILLILLFFLPIASVITTLLSTPVQAAWFNENWQYRQRLDITITSSSSDISNLQMYFTVNTSVLISTEKLQSSCQDLRFTSVSGRLLQYYIDSGCNTTATKIWVMADLIPKNTTTYQIYMYYGNPAASAGSESGYFDNVVGLAAYWTFNDGSGISVADSSKNAFTATINTGTFTTGKFGTALSKNGSGQGATATYGAGSDLDFPANTQVTVEFWLNSPTSHTSRLINAIASGGLNVPNIGTALYFGVFSGNTVTFNSAISYDGAWHHYALSYNGTSVSYYKDGSFVSSQNLAANWTTGSKTFYLGGDASYPLNGALDDVKVYRTSRNSTQILADFNNTSCGGLVCTIATSPVGTVNPSSVSFNSEEIGPGPVANWGLDEGYGDSSTGNGPVAYWNLDENTNITATDLSGNGNTGTLTGSPTWVSGIYNSSVNFNGSSNYITINNSTSLNIRAPITLSAWIYPTSTASFQNVISKRNTTSPYSLRINNGTNLEYYFHDGTAYREYIKTGVIKLNTWQFVAATNDGTNINLYVNGVNVLSTTTPYTPATTTDTIQISGWHGINELFSGSIDDVKIYNYARSANQVIEDMNRDVHSNGTAGKSAYGFNYGATWQTEDQCVVRKCLSFNGTSNYVSLYPNLQTTSKITISSWINTRTLSLPSNFRMIFSSSDGASYLALVTNGLATPFVSFDIGGTQRALNSNFIPKINHWYYVTATYDGNYIRIYVDGILRNTSAQYVGSLAGFSSGSMYIGKYLAAGYEFSGKLDELKIYPYARTDDQIKSDYNSAAELLGKQNQTYLSNDLVGYWKMDESSWNNNCSTTSVIDSSGNGFNGKSCPNGSGPTGGAVGKFGNAGYFDGVNDYVEVADNDLLDPANAITVAMWFRPDQTLVDFQAVLGKGGGASFEKGYEFATSNDQFGFWVNGNTHIATTTKPANGELTFWVGTYDGKTIKLYKNGSLVSSTNYVGTITNTTLPFRIGRPAEDGGNNLYVQGMFDDVRVYNRAFTQAEITSLYNWAPGPIEYLKFDENTGSSINDSSGNNNKGTWNGTLGSQWSTGKVGTAGEFNGTDNYVNISDSSTLDITGDMTLSTWIKPNATQNASADIISKHGNGGFLIEQNNTTNNQYYFGWDSTGSGGWNCLTTYFSLTGGVWQHLEIVKSGAVAKYYINGVSTGSCTGTNQAISANSLALKIGSWSSSGNRFWNGLIDDFKFYNYARTSGQVVEDMNGGHPVGGSPIASQAIYYNFDEGNGNTAASSNPVAYWRFDENTGTIATDSGSGGHNGTLTNSPSWIKGVYESALNFTAALNQNVTTSSVVSSATTNITMETWVYWTNGPTGNSTFYYNGNSGSNGYGLKLNNGSGSAGNKVTVILGGLAFDVTSSTLVLTPKVWTHIALTRSGTTWTLYKNGILDSIGTTNPGTPTTSTIIGSGFDGILDDSKFYNYARTPAQIIEDMNRDVHNNGFLGSTDNAFNYGGTWNSGSSCKVNGCLDIDSATDYVTPGDISLTDGLTQMSISMWINPAITANSEIIGKWGDTSTTSNFLVRTNSPGSEIVVFIASSLSDNGSNYFYTTDLNLSNGVWTKLQIIYDGTQNATNRITIYSNGRKVNGGYIGTIPTSMTSGSTSNLKLGDADFSVFTALPAKYDDLKIYNTAITAEQAQIDLNSGYSENFGVGAPSEASLLSDGAGNSPTRYWNLDSNTGTTAYDISGNNSNGSFVGTPVWTPGKYGSSLTFADGQDINVPDYSLAGAFTMQYWYKTNDTTSVKISLGEDSGTSGGGPKIGISSSTFFVRIISSTDSTINGKTDGKWHFVSITRNASDKVDLYLDGGTANRLFSDTAQTGTFTLSNLGSNSDNSQNFIGTLDDVKVYDYARTQAQLAYDYNRGAPVGWWWLDECQGSTAYDASGNGNNGAITIGTGAGTGHIDSVGNCTTSGTAWYNGLNGKFNSSLSFDGIDDYVSMTASLSSFSSLSTGTITGWFKRANTSNRDIIFSLGESSTNDRFTLEINVASNQFFRVLAREANSNVLDIYSTKTYDDTSWHNFAVVNDNTSTIKVYIDGLLQTTIGTQSNSWFNTVTSKDYMNIGKDTIGLFSGQIDDFRIYNYALSADQIKQVYNGASVFFGPTSGTP